MAEQVRLREAAEQDVVQMRQTLAGQGTQAQGDAMVSERAHLLRIMAHEVRQPLHSAGAAMQAVNARLASSDQVLDDDRLRPDMAVAEKALAAAREVLDNVLCVADLLDRSGPLSPEPTDLGFLVEMTLLDLPQPLHRRVVVDAGGQAATRVAVDAQLFRLALRNLLCNAFQHGGPGQVSVRLVAHRGAPEWSVAVQDEGHGLSEAAEAAVQALLLGHSPWPPAPTRAAAHGGGLGLGLQIAHRVAQLHGGRLRCTVAPTGGLCVALCFPNKG